MLRQIRKGKAMSFRDLLPFLLAEDPNRRCKYNLALACEKNGNVEESLNNYQQIMATDIGYRDVSKRVTDLRSGSTT